MLRALIAALALTTATVAAAEERGTPAAGESTIFTTKVMTTALVLAVPMTSLLCCRCRAGRWWRRPCASLSPAFVLLRVGRRLPLIVVVLRWRR